jgi:hypothetical protein
MEDSQLFGIGFSFFFAGVWLAATTMLGFMSGWFKLQQWFEAPADEPLLKLRGQSGSMGIGVSFGGCLTLSAHRRGLGVAVWRIFGPFQRPFLVPWNEIEAQPSKTLFTPMTKLSLGKPAAGTLKISVGSWARLVEAAGPVVSRSIASVSPPTRASVARGLFFEWFVIAAFFAAFFIFAMRSTGEADTMPIGVLAFPVILFAVVQLIRYARQS